MPSFLLLILLTTRQVCVASVRCTLEAAGTGASWASRAAGARVSDPTRETRSCREEGARALFQTELTCPGKWEDWADLRVPGRVGGLGRTEVPQRVRRPAETMVRSPGQYSGWGRAGPLDQCLGSGYASDLGPGSWGAGCH